MIRTTLRATAMLAAGAFALAGCGGGDSDPLGGDTDTATAGGGGAVVVGSQQYYSNEIIAELYAQALEAGGYEVDRQFQIGQREVDRKSVV